MSVFTRAYFSESTLSSSECFRESSVCVCVCAVNVNQGNTHRNTGEKASITLRLAHTLSANQPGWVKLGKMDKLDHNMSLIC